MVLAMAETNDYLNLTEQIKVNSTNGTAIADNPRCSLTVVICAITWLLLSCISALIYCCNYWEVFKPATRRDTDRDADEELSVASEESELERQSMLLTQVSEASST